MYEDLDLNIENYNLNDLLNLFKLNNNFQENDLKCAKKIVLQLHPDKSNMDKKKLSLLLYLSILYTNIKCFSLPPTKCTNNKPVNSYSEYIQEFRKSSCSPIVFVPGIMSSNLRVVADCKVKN